MAYVSHSPYRACVRNSGPAHLDFGLMGRAALAALAAGAVIVALSGASAGGGREAQAFGKSDRIAAASVVESAPSAGYVVDQAAMTTTIQKGAATPLSDSSPYVSATK